jgi:hypothetical protein
MFIVIAFTDRTGERKWNEKFSRTFLRYDTDHRENDVCNNSCNVACFLFRRNLFTELLPNNDTRTELGVMIYIPSFIKIS